ncbi:hypothetical protein, conserved [Babesia bigemina]|uniref:NudC domain-containing protein 1 n=1 Tax=Babesia bigemina TaxID=5866 RepID=A0A061D9E5_BABBI|nr:hypothetical protein, conserved [Babesia bigemina]CDR96617.1 hypothetical protein, conserved [Babesia bigemina]|eukprot:XP_012768803.1 hypothetical protein, conserved [Babesia bigemina]
MKGRLVATLAAAIGCGWQTGRSIGPEAYVSQCYSGNGNVRSCRQQCGTAYLAAPSAIASRNRALPLGAGWGRTDRYCWNEDAQHVVVAAAVPPTVSADDIDVTIQSNSLHASNRKAPLIPIISGNTKGSIDVDGSFWTLEEERGILELKITLKKAEKHAGDWFGVIRNERVQQQTYEPVDHRDAGVTKVQSLEPKGVFWQRTFMTIDAHQLEEMFVRWMSREQSETTEFGKPKLPVNVAYVQESGGGKVVYQTDNLDLDEYLQVVIIPVITEENKHAGGGAQLTFVNSPTTRMISGQMGAEKAEKTVTALNTLIQTFERDVHKIEGLMKHRQQQSESFDYMGSAAYLHADNLESYAKYHEELRSLSPQKAAQYDPKRVFKDDKAGLTIDWNPTDDPPHVPNEKNEEKKKILINKLTEAIKHTKRPQPQETVKSLVNNVRQSLALSDVEYDQLMQKADERINRENALIAEKQRIFSQMKSVPALMEAQPTIEEIVAEVSQPKSKDTFDIAMAHPERSMLAKKYATLSSVQKEQLRSRWKTNEKRLKLLITELLEAPPEKCSTLCNTYTDLLISEDYPTLMRSYLCFHEVKDKHEKERLAFLNQFVLSLYKDQKIYLLHDEKIQLQKIKQIILWARNEFQNLNDLVMQNKQQYDTNFMCYLNLAISKEVERIREEHGDGSLDSGAANPEAQPWLCVLTIIQRAVNSIAKADMAEDLNFITTIVSFDDPQVRSYMLEFILATMPRSDWKGFKDLIMSASESLIRKPADERDDLEHTEPHFVEAIMQLREEVEKMIPDWIIDELLSEDDRNFMIQNNRQKIPLLQLELEPKQHVGAATHLPDAGKTPAEKTPVLPLKPT